MDLIATLRSKISALQEGDYSPGLKAIILHIETAFGHLSRGQQKNEETAFTDAIYRTNQAFEGSIKEAYRVLTGKDPDKQRPYDIEQYLEKEHVFRERVLSQFTAYRTEWRNPSTHDYKLDFDESEAFLALVTVSAFACLLFDQIAEHVSFTTSKAATDSHSKNLRRRLGKRDVNLLDRATRLIAEFVAQKLPVTTSPQRRLEIQVLGALAGFLASAAPDITVGVETKLSEIDRGDMLLSLGEERVLIELKSDRAAAKMLYNAIAQVEHYLLVGGIKNAILFFYSDEPCEIQREDRDIAQIGGRIAILRPKKHEPNKEPKATR
jgi:hypothetical protein